MRKILLSLMMCALMCVLSSCKGRNNSSESTGSEPVVECAAEKCAGCDSTSVKDSCCKR